MEARTCVRHPEAAAVYRCDGCGELLCAECGEEGHRLVFCRLCGERALPLDGSGEVAEPPRGIMDRRRDRIVRSAAGYGMAEALTYPFRGTGGQVFFAFVALVSLLDLVSAVIPLVGGCVMLVPWVLILLLIPKFLFRIANTTAQGDDELPDWPEFEFWEVFRAVLLFAFVVLLCLVPAALLMQAADCSPGAILTGEGSLGVCLAMLALGLVLAVALWIPAFGAVSLYDTFLAALRLDLHARALLVSPREIMVTVPLLAALLFLRALLPALLGGIPVLGIVLGHAVVAYTLFTGAHLVGLYFRRHWHHLEALYLG